MENKMLTYDLAKKLKDAGFPFRRIKGGESYGSNAPQAEDKKGDLYGYLDFNPEGKTEIGEQHFFVPSLSELIEACGKGLLQLVRNSSGWTAYPTDLSKTLAQSASTPDQAVALLWFALNKKS